MKRFLLNLKVPFDEFLIKIFPHYTEIYRDRLARYEWSENGSFKWVGIILWCCVIVFRFFVIILSWEFEV
jgi:hypothetical protein